MPRRIVKKKNRLLDKQRMIMSRLMQFNLKLEDYVYKQTPMSIKHAKLYMKEIISFREHCTSDERTLQVIEKLTRCMKGIIKEQREMKISTNKDGNNSPVNEQRVQLNHRTSNTSPVFSLPNPDKTNFSEYRTGTDEDNENETLANEIPVIDLCEDIDLDSVETEFCKKSPPKISIDVDIERVISDLSLKTIDEIPNTLLENNSQNILDINETLDNASALENTVNDSPRTEKSASSAQNNSGEINSIIIAECNHEDSETVTPVINNGDNIINNNYLKSSTNIAKVKVKQKVIRLQKINKNRQKSTVVKRKIQSKNTVNNPKASRVKNIVERHNKAFNDNKINGVTKTLTKTDTPKLKRITENLAWVENITHVRKVSNSEYDSKLVISDESFWENYALPEDWTDESFLCTL